MHQQLDMPFGISQGSELGPPLFNLYVSNPQRDLSCEKTVVVVVVIIIIIIITIMYNWWQNWGDIVLRWSNLGEQLAIPLPLHLHPKLECLLFSTGSSNSSTKLHGGSGGGKALFPFFKFLWL